MNVTQGITDILETFFPEELEHLILDRFSSKKDELIPSLKCTKSLKSLRLFHNVLVYLNVPSIRFHLIIHSWLLFC